MEAKRQSMRMALTSAFKICLLSLPMFLASTVNGESVQQGEKQMSSNLFQHPAHPSYLMDATGKTFVPIGLNICFVRNAKPGEEAKSLATFHSWFKAFSENGGNYVRIWCSVPLFNVMPERFGEFSEQNLAHLREIVRYAEEMNLKLKFTLEQFRNPNPENAKGNSFQKGLFLDPAYSLYAKDMKGYCESAECRRMYLAKAKVIADALASSPALVAIDLWNEIDAIGSVHGYVGEWTEAIMPEVQKLFPRQLVLQNLGSHCNLYSYADYHYQAHLKNNNILQIHRYLDPGAPMEICQAPMDVLCADSIKAMTAYGVKKPILLAETGAVKPNHTGPSELYEKDSQGTLLHDALFAPFFAGSAGCGQFWHWDSYIDRWNLWHHFARFAKAIEGLDPAAEQFSPAQCETAHCRIYILHGRRHDLYWLKDKRNTWQSELVEGKPPQVVQEFYLPLWAKGQTTAYFPWEDRHTVPEIKDEYFCHVPAFRRSLVLRVQHNGHSKYLQRETSDLR